MNKESTMNRSLQLASVSALALPLLLVAACDSGSTGPGQRQPVNMQLTASLPTTGAAAPAIEITSLRLVVGGADLGNAGCSDDCGGDDDDAEEEGAPSLISVPPDGGAVAIATEQTRPGRYTEAQIEVVRPTSAILGATPGWPPDATIEIAGRYNGTPFTLTLPIEGEFRETLNPPVDVVAGAPETITVTITLPVASWLTANGTALDPNDPAQRAQIEANARGSFVADDDDD